ncbi:GTR11 protein, partial [Atractosteus spatula]|nr:GTR11 protein [Atractosteus spatula]
MAESENDLEHLEASEKKPYAWTLILTVCSAAIGGTLQYGYNISIINAPTAHVQRFVNETVLERWGTQLEGYQITLIWSFIVSMFSLGGLVGALLAGPMAIHFGRKKSLLLNNLFVFVSAALALASRAARSFEMIILARILVGINAGVSMNIQPMYFGESAPKHLRGAVTLSSASFTAFGIVLGQVIGLREILGGESHWPFLLATNAIPGLIQLLTLPWFPESPRYLLIDKGDKEACTEALRRLRGCGDLSREMDEMLQEKAAAMGQRAKGPWELVQDRGVRWQLITVVVASSAMQLCGNDSMYFYASYVFQEAGIQAEKIQYAAIGTGSCEFIAAVTCNLLIERLGRKVLITGGYLLMACWAVVFMVTLALQEKVSWMPYLGMTCIFAFILSFGMGPAGVTGILPTEIFEQTARPAAYMIAGSLMWLNLILMGLLFPFIVSGLGTFCFVPFCSVCLLSALFISLFLPETKGKSTLEITKEFNRRNFKGTEQQQYQLGEVLRSTSL